MLALTQLYLQGVLVMRCNENIFCCSPYTGTLRISTVAMVVATLALRRDEHCMRRMLENVTLRVGAMKVPNELGGRPSPWCNRAPWTGPSSR